MKGQEIVTCKQCGGNKVQPIDRKGALIVTSVLLIGLGIWIPIIGWFLMIPAGVIMLLVGIGAKASKSKSQTFRCLECKHVFKVGKDTFKQYQTYLKG